MGTDGWNRQFFVTALLGAVFYALASPLISADEVRNPKRVFVPKDAHLVNVRDHGVKGDGVTDDTEALRKLVQANLNQHKTLYFPAGTYLISDSILWATEKGEFWPWLTWQGEGRGQTFIRLKDASPGFSDRTKPKSLIKTGCYDGERRQNAAHNCYFFDLTVSVGRKNPGAIGIDYCSNNNGAIVRVDIVSEDGAGVAGVSMTRDAPGPSLIQHVSIRGFETGIALSHLLFGMTFEHIHLEKQSRVGMLIRGNMAAVRNLISRNEVPAIRLEGWATLLTLLDSELSGGAKEQAAIEATNAPTLLLRRVSTNGYKFAAKIVEGKKTTEVPNGTVEEFMHGQRFALFADSAKLRTLDLPVRDAPLHFGQENDWASVVQYGAQPDGKTDASPAIQKAIDSGKSVIYFPHGKYRLGKTVLVRGTVKQIVGFNSDLRGGTEGVLFRCEGTDGPVSFERLYLNGKVEHANRHPVTLRYTLGPGIVTVGERRTWFFEDVLTAKFTITKDSQLFARQFNCEPPPPGAGFINDGGEIWVLGLKTEWGNTIGVTRNGGRTEILGGLMLPAQGFKDRTVPAFVVEDAEFSGSWNEITFGTGNYSNVVREIRKGKTSNLNPVGEGTQRAWSLYSTKDR